MLSRGCALARRPLPRLPLVLPRVARATMVSATPPSVARGGSGAFRSSLLTLPSPRIFSAAAAGGTGLAVALLLRQQDQQEATAARCDGALRLSNEADLVRSIATISAEEGRVRTLARIIWRCLELVCILAPCLLTLPLLRVRTLRLRARWLRLLVATLERCGPVGIKWGQWASTRYDIFEDDLCDALGALTNAAPVHPHAWTAQVFREELGAELGSVFDGFDPVPIASGSIGQVHLCRLKEAHGPRFPAGTAVAVKVQHPGLAERLGIDMAILMKAASLIDRAADGLGVDETVAQFASNFYMQLDFRDEADNLRRFSKQFGSSFWRAIVSFPTPVDSLVSQHVVVESFEEGESVASYLHKAGDAPKVTKWKRDESGTRWVPEDATQSVSSVARDADDLVIREKVALVGVQAYLKMLMVNNFIHADLHPGNVLVRMEDVSLLGQLQRWLLIGDRGARAPHIVFLDAGLAAKFDDRIFGNVQGFFEAIIGYDGPKFGRAILGLAPTQPRVKDPEGFVAEVAEKMEAMKQEREAGFGRAGDNIRSFMASVRAHRVSLDPTVMVALMSMLVLEGWQFRLDPATSIIGAIKGQLERRTSLLGFLL